MIVRASAEPATGFGLRAVRERVGALPALSPFAPAAASGTELRVSPPRLRHGVEVGRNGGPKRPRILGAAQAAEIIGWDARIRTWEAGCAAPSARTCEHRPRGSPPPLSRHADARRKSCCRPRIVAPIGEGQRSIDRYAPWPEWWLVCFTEPIKRPTRSRICVRYDVRKLRHAFGLTSQLDRHIADNLGL